jgi:hypothetical protein
VTGYGIYEAIMDPSLRNLAGLGMLIMVIGFAVLLLSVLREKITINSKDKYISEVKR